MVGRAGEGADDYFLTNRCFGVAMSYFMSPQTHLGLLPSGQGERGALGTGMGITSPENLLPGSGEVEVSAKHFGAGSQFFKKKIHSQSACQ